MWAAIGWSKIAEGGVVRVASMKRYRSNLDTSQRRPGRTAGRRPKAIQFRTVRGSTSKRAATSSEVRYSGLIVSIVATIPLFPRKCFRYCCSEPHDDVGGLSNTLRGRSDRVFFDTPLYRAGCQPSPHPSGAEADLPCLSKSASTRRRIYSDAPAPPLLISRPQWSQWYSVR